MLNYSRKQIIHFINLDFLIQAFYLFFNRVLKFNKTVKVYKWKKNTNKSLAVLPNC